MKAIITCILQLKENLKTEVYLVGGSLRDILLNREVKDLDLVVASGAKEFAVKLQGQLEGALVELDKQHEIYRIVLKTGLTIDIAKMRGEVIQQDLAFRDFTINAMAYDIVNEWPLQHNKLIDPFDGRQHIKQKLIRHISPEVFMEDPARLMRAARLMAELEFEIDEETIQLINKHAELLKTVAGERITPELFAILKKDNSYFYLSYMEAKLGLLNQIFPDLEVMKDVGECKYHVVDCWTHSIYTMKLAESVIYAKDFFEDHIREAYERHTSEIIAADRTRLELLKLGALFHDIGKPSAKRVDNKGRTRFRGHEITGAEIVRDYAERLRLSTRERDILYKYVALHMIPLVLYKTNDVSGRALYKTFNDMQEETLDILLISLADIIATRKLLDPNEEMGMFKVHIEYIANNYLTRFRPIEKLSSIITGNELMETFNIAEGQRVGQLLEEIRKAIYFGQISESKENVLNYVKALLEESK